MSFLSYTYRDTPIHKLNAITKLIVTITGVTLGAIWFNPIFLIPLDLVGICICLIAKVPRSWYKIVALAMGGASPFILFLSLFQHNPALFKVLDPEFATYTIYGITLPLIGTAKLTYGGLIWAFAIINRFALLLFFFSFMYTTPMSEVADILKKLKLPAGAVFVFMTAYKFIPYMSIIIDKITSAQKLRGWEVKSRNPIKRGKKLVTFINPVIQRTSLIIDEISAAAEIRGFGSRKLTPIMRFKMRLIDYIVSISALIVLGVALYLLARYNVGLI